MTFDEILGFLNQWINTFGGVIRQFSIPVRDVLPDIIEIVISDYILDMTILGLMFNVGFGSFIAYTMYTWIKKALAR